MPHADRRAPDSAGPAASSRTIHWGQISQGRSRRALAWQPCSCPGQAQPPIFPQPDAWPCAQEFREEVAIMQRWAAWLRLHPAAPCCRLVSAVHQEQRAAADARRIGGCSSSQSPALRCTGRACLGLYQRPPTLLQAEAQQHCALHGRLLCARQPVHRDAVRATGSPLPPAAQVRLQGGGPACRALMRRRTPACMPAAVSAQSHRRLR